MRVQIHVENEYINVVRTQLGRNHILNGVYLGRISPARRAKNVSHGSVDVALSSAEGT
jgi:hypothetical protein